MAKPVFAAIGFLLLAAMLMAQEHPGPNDKPGKTDSGSLLSKSLQGFLSRAARHGNAEVELARMAMKRAVTPEVQNYADVMITDLTRSNRELADLAKEKGLNLTQSGSDDSDDDAEIAGDLAHLSGVDFDNAYMEQMAHEHAWDLQQYLHLAAFATDEDVRLFAQRQIPQVRDHLRMARQIMRLAESRLSARVRLAGGNAGR